MTDDIEFRRPCPRCGVPVNWNRDARWKPFCSERCKLIDLGAWFAEEHAIPGASVPDSDSTPGDEDRHINPEAFHPRDRE